MSGSQVEQGTIRDNVLKEIEDVLWLDEFQKNERSRKTGSGMKDMFEDRCTVCTLPTGTCIHTRQWMDDSYNYKHDDFESNPSSLEQEIADALAMVSEEVPVATTAHADDIDVNSMQWNPLDQRPSDKIGSSPVALSAPSERGWHSTVELDEKYILVFGGFRYRKNAVPHPFKAIPHQDEIEYLNDVMVYDIINLSWHDSEEVIPDPDPNSEDADLYIIKPSLKRKNIIHPEGRYGHSAGCLHGQRMIIYGGKGARGKLFDDTWIYHFKDKYWEQITRNGELSLPVPAPRYFSSCVCNDHGTDMYLFGGTNGTENFGDLWRFRADNSRHIRETTHHSERDGEVMLWERLVAVGMPPSPRYGHNFIRIDEERFAVVGGCAVSPTGELVGSNLSVHESKKLQDYSNLLQNKYGSENKVSQMGGHIINEKLGYNDLDPGSFEDQSTMLRSQSLAEISQMSSPTRNSGKGVIDTHGVNGETLKDTYAQAARLAGTLHQLETESRVAEIGLVANWNLSQATKSHNMKAARHPNPKLDIVFLNVLEMMWKTQTYPAIKGTVPGSRIHFGAECIGDFILAFGGIEPTSLQFCPVEKKSTDLYALNMRTWKWNICIPINDNKYLEEPMQIAQADIIRAEKRVLEERDRGFSLGVANGKTVEFAEAQAVLEVCKWRKAALYKEQQDLVPPPPPRFAASVTRLGRTKGRRLLFLGGWNVDKAVAKGDSMVLNLEQDHEKQRRIDDEYKAKLNRDKIHEEAQVIMENLETVAQLREKRRREKMREEAELKLMAKADLLSSLPPLSVPPRVRLVKRNAETMWVAWDRITKNSERNSIDPESVTYMLYMKCGYQNFLVDDRVLCEPVVVASAITALFSGSRGGKRKKKSGKQTSEEGAQPAEQLSHFFNDRIVRHPGEITRVWGDGHFDVLFDDGATEKRVPRVRLMLMPTSAAAAAHLMPPGASFEALAVRNRRNRKEVKKTRASKALEAIRNAGSKAENSDSPLKNRPGTSESMMIAGGSPPGSRSGSRSSKKPGHPGDRRGSTSSPPQPRRKKELTAEESPTTDSPLGGSPKQQRRKRLVKQGSASSIITEESYGYILDDEEIIQPSSIKTLKVAEPVPSVQIEADSGWRLVYTGNDCEYICEGLVSKQALETEPGITVPVAFRLQTHGCDFPEYERSQLSKMEVFYTKNDIVVDLNAIEAVKATVSRPSTEEGSAVISGISKTKKDIVTAVIKGMHAVQLERRANTVLGLGTADHYL